MPGTALRAVGSGINVVLKNKQLTIQNVFPHDLNIIITVRPGLFMLKPQSMTCGGKELRNVLCY
jgi:hypothetical protein